MWPIPASRKASTSRPRRKISIARVTRILHKRVFITFAHESRSDVAAGWGGRWCWPLPLGGASRTGRRAQQPTLRLAFSWFSPVISCYFPPLFAAMAKAGCPQAPPRGCRSGAKELGEKDNAIVPRSHSAPRDRKHPRAADRPLSVFFCSLQWTVAGDRVCTVYAGLNDIAVPAAALKCRGGSPRGRVGQIRRQCTARTSSASRAA
jgi:hypothetical protein